MHCVIVGFSHKDANSGTKFIFNENGERTEAKNINGYLRDMPNVFVESRQNPICDVPKIGIGNKPIDGGNYLFSEEEMKAFVKKEPSSEKYFRKWLGADEFINRSFRYCLWLGDCSPNELRSMPECYKRVQAVREYRLASKSAGTRKIADTPTRFHVENFPKGNYLLVPSTSSENRQYVPIGFLDASIIASNATHLIPNATLYHFGVLTSNVHNTWMRAVAGRLKSDYRYSKDIVYNNFPWCAPTDAQKAKIEQTAQAILDARTKYPDSSLADLYDEATMPLDLRKAHAANDKAVMTAYGFAPKLTETEIVVELFALYGKMAG